MGAHTNDVIEDLAAARKLRWRQCPLEVKDFPHICPGLRPSKAPPPGDKAATASGVLIGGRPAVLEAGSWKKGAKPSSTVYVNGSPLSQVGHAAAKERGPKQRYMRHPTVSVAAGKTRAAPDFHVDVSAKGWPGRHPATGFLHSIADTRVYKSIELLDDKIRDLDEVVLGMKPNDSTALTQKKLESLPKKYKLRLEDAKKASMDLELKLGEQEEQRRKNRWKEYILPLKPAIFRIDANTMGLNLHKIDEPREVLDKLEAYQDLKTLRREIWTTRKQLREKMRAFGLQTLELLKFLRRELKTRPRLQINLSNSYGYPKDNPIPIRPWKFTSMLRRSLEPVVHRAPKAFGPIEFDIWNEPDLREYFMGWKEADWPVFFEVWDFVAQIIREKRPEALIVGPSLGEFNENTLKSFLTHVKKAKELVPDILSWHEQYSAHGIKENINDIRKWMKDNDIHLPIHKKVNKDEGEDPIDINEYLLDGKDEGSEQRIFEWYTRPGRTAQFIAGLEAAKVRAACHTTTRNIGPHGGRQGGSDVLETLNGILADGWKPRSTWYVYKYYADMQGQFFEINPMKSCHKVNAKTVLGVGSRRKDKVCLLLGRDDYIGEKPLNQTISPRLIIKLQNLPKALGSNYTIEIVRIHIHKHHQYEHAWTLKEGKDYEATRDKKPRGLHLDIFNVGRYDALFVRLGAAKEA